MIIGIDASRAFVEHRTGTEEYSYQVIKHILRLPASYPHHFVLFVRPKAILPKWVISPNVTIVPIKFRFLWTQVGLAMATWKIFTIPERKSMEIPFRDRNYLDILWIPAHTLPVLRRPNLKTVVTIHGLEYKWLPEYRSWLQRWYLPLSTYYAAKQADRLIAVSENTKRELLKEVSITPNKLKVILEGAEGSDNRKTQRIRMSEGQRSGILQAYGVQEGKYILFVGSLQPRKNLPALIQAFSIFAGSHPDYKLVLVGGKGWQSQEIFRAPARYDVQEKVVFTGRVSEGARKVLLTSASMYVQPSLTEGFGLPVVEAMALGVPTIVSNGGALKEVVGIGGIVVNLGPKFVSELSTTLKRVATMKPAEKLALAKRAKKRATELTWERTARETMRLIEQIGISN